MINVRFKIEEHLDFAVTCKFPEKWNELTEQQLLYIAKNYEAWSAMAKNEQSFLKAKAMLLLNISNLKRRRELKKLCHALSFTDDNATHNVLDFTDFVFVNAIALTENKLPVVRVGMFTKWYGPSAILSDLTIEEFAFAFSAYVSFAQRKLDKDLDVLFAILYREKNKDFEIDGIKRHPFKYQLVDGRVKTASKVPYEIKYAVYLFFAGVMNYFGNHKQYKTIFRRANENEKGGTGNFIETARILAGPRLGNINETLNTNLILFLKELADTIENNKPKKK
jgi:hypothetical protein